MANYTTTKLSITATLNSNVASGGVPSSGTITITPRKGYVVSASDFSAPNLPTNITSIVFTDVTTAGEIGNTILATITLGPLFSVTGNSSINLGIVGEAKRYDEEAKSVNVNVSIIDSSPATEPYSGTSSVSVESGYALVDTGYVSNSATRTISGTSIKNTSTKIGTISVTATSGYYFIKQPYLDYNGNDRSIIRLKRTSVTKDSKNRISVYNFDIFFKSETTVNTLNNINIIYSSIVIPTASDKIRWVSFGSSEVSTLGETKRIKVYGDPGAEFDLTVTKASDGSSIIDGRYQNVDVFDTHVGMIKGFNKKLIPMGKKSGITYCEFYQDFPAGTDTYRLNIYPKGTTTLGSKISASLPTYTINQYANPVLTLAATVTRTGLSAPSNIVYTGRPNAYPNDLATEGVPKYFQISYTLTHSGGGAVSKVDDDPKWSSTDATASDWTYSLPSTNGGTHIELINLAATYGTPTATLTADVLVKKWGNASVTMTINLDNIFTT